MEQKFFYKFEENNQNIIRIMTPSDVKSYMRSHYEIYGEHIKDPIKLSYTEAQNYIENIKKVHDDKYINERYIDYIESQLNNYKSNI